MRNHLLGLLLALPSLAAGQNAIELQPGQWVQVKGHLDPQSGFQVDQIEVLEPQKYEELIGTIDAVRKEESGEWVVDLLGQPIWLSDRTDWQGWSTRDPQELLGQRAKVEGYWRDSGKFSAREWKARDKGRDRLVGPVARVTRDGERCQLQVMRWKLDVPANFPLEAEKPLADFARTEIPLSDPSWDLDQTVRYRDDDDRFRGRLLAPGLWAGVQLEWQHTRENNYNLDSTDQEDRVDDEFPVRAELIWSPGDWGYGLIGYRHRWRARDDEDDGRSSDSDGQINEAFGYFRNVGDWGLDFQFGRQDFDERREWLYDENLDGLRIIQQNLHWRHEWTYATTWSDGSEVEENTDTWMWVAEREMEADWRWGAYAIHRPVDVGVDYEPWHLGLRSYGEWTRDLKGWAELATLRGTRGSQDLDGYALDVGATWTTSGSNPWYFTAGYAMGSGDDQPGAGDDQTFYQTGLQDNNDKFGGVTSFRYYGEVFDPELSNLGIWTVGVGRRFGERNSLDLVLHRYEQQSALAVLADNDLDQTPNGIDADLGWEANLIFGSRSYEAVDIEIVVGHFFPGDAFPDADNAWLAKVQVRVSPF